MLFMRLALAIYKELFVLSRGITLISENLCELSEGERSEQVEKVFVPVDPPFNRDPNLNLSNLALRTGGAPRNSLPTRARTSDAPKEVI